MQRVIERYLHAPAGRKVATRKELAEIGRLAVCARVIDTTFIAACLYHCRRQRLREDGHGWSRLPEHVQERVSEIYEKSLTAQLRGGDPEASLPLEERIELGIITAAAGNIPPSVFEAILDRHFDALVRAPSAGTS
jgi:hypothetical protein